MLSVVTVVILLVSLVVYGITPEIKTEKETSPCVEDEVVKEEIEIAETVPNNRYQPSIESWNLGRYPMIPTEYSEEKSVEKLEVTQQSGDEQISSCEYSEYEIDLVARTIFQESGICSEYCQWLVGSTILNLADERGGVEDVVFDYNTFNVAYRLFDDTPSELSYKVARRVTSGDRDYKVKAFRTDYYHGFGNPYIEVDNVYFSEY